jgi:CheY-like chemotaxis protein
MGNAELIKDEVSSNESDLIEEMTSNIFKSVERGKKIGYQILTFSKGGAPVKRWVDITKIIQDTANIIFARSDIQFNLIKEKKISTATELMYVDLEQMTQVFQNLFLNSREAIENTGTVDCEIYDSILENKKGIVIEITDSGKGIDADKIQYVFDPYYSTKDNSSGLGLTVSYNIIKNHGGTINISSRLNEGTKVTIFIPAEKQYVEKNQKKETIQEIDGNNANVLILDDEPMILYILERMLKKLNFTVYSAPSGRELVNKYKELKSKGIPVDFLILDIYVPGELNGQETLNEIRLIDPDIMAVATTGYTDDNIISDPEKHGFQTVLPKPYSRMDLNEVIHKIYQLKKMQ